MHRVRAIGPSAPLARPRIGGQYSCHASVPMAGRAALAAGQCRPLPPALRPGRPSLATVTRPVRLPLAPRSQQGRQEGPSSATLTEAAPRAPPAPTVVSRKQEGASTDLSVILPRLKKVG